MTKGEKAGLWFTVNESWEKTVFAIDAPSLAEAHDAMLPLGGLARIGCDDTVAPHRWKEIREIASISHGLAVGLYRTAIRVGSRPGQWRGTLQSVAPQEFRLVQVYDGQAWVPAQPEFAVAASRHQNYEPC